jgi:hypothetical protein
MTDTPHDVDEAPIGAYAVEQWIHLEIDHVVGTFLVSLDDVLNRFFLIPNPR